MVAAQDRRGNDERIHLLLDQQTHQTPLFVGGIVGIDENDTVASRTQRAFDAAGNLAEERVADIGKHKPDRLGLLVAQARRQPVHDISHVLRRLLHGGGGCRRRRALDSSENAGNRCRRHARGAGHIGHGRSLTQRTLLKLYVIDYVIYRSKPLNVKRHTRRHFFSRDTRRRLQL